MTRSNIHLAMHLSLKPMQTICGFTATTCVHSFSGLLWLLRQKRSTSNSARLIFVSKQNGIRRSTVGLYQCLKLRKVTWLQKVPSLHSLQWIWAKEKAWCFGHRRVRKMTKMLPPNRLSTVFSWSHLTSSCPSSSLFWWLFSRMKKRSLLSNRPCLVSKQWLPNDLIWVATTFLAQLSLCTSTSTAFRCLNVLSCSRIHHFTMDSRLWRSRRLLRRSMLTFIALKIMRFYKSVQSVSQRTTDTSNTGLTTQTRARPSFRLISSMIDGTNLILWSAITL